MHKNTADTGANGVQVQGVCGGWAWVRLGTAVAQRRVCAQPHRELFEAFCAGEMRIAASAMGLCGGDDLWQNSMREYGMFYIFTASIKHF